VSRLWFNLNREKLLHNVAELSVFARATVEGLIGRALREYQQVSILPLDRALEPPAQKRLEAWNDLRAILEDVHQSVRASAIPVEQIEQIVDETCEDVRYGK
jgi:hypothetical protein